MKPIKNWQRRPLQCFFCGSSLGVKYEVDHDGKMVYSCKKCVLPYEETQTVTDIAKILIDYKNKNHIMASTAILADYAKELYDEGYRKQNKGVWTTHDDGYGYQYAKCSYCGYEYFDPNGEDNIETFYHFCPDCAAKMERSNP